MAWRPFQDPAIIGHNQNFGQYLGPTDISNPTNDFITKQAIDIAVWAVLRRYSHGCDSFLDDLEETGTMLPKSIFFGWIQIKIPDPVVQSFKVITGCARVLRGERRLVKVAAIADDRTRQAPRPCQLRPR
jgi:hypothetical protein